MKDNEIAGVGNHYTAEFWEYNPLIAGRWNTDPVVYPSVSPYSVFKGNPIMYSDPNGDDVKKGESLKDPKNAARSAGVDMVGNTQTGKEILQDYDQGGANGFYPGGAKGKYADNVTLEFNYVDESKVPQDQRRGGGTDIYYMNSKGSWATFDGNVPMSELNKDTKFKVNMWVNQAHTSAEGSAYTYGHELAVHNLAFMSKTLSVLRSDGPSAFMQEYSRSTTIPYKADVNRNGYNTEYGSHMVMGLGLNTAYNNLNREISAGLSGLRLQNFRSILQNNNRKATELANRVIKFGMFGTPTSFDTKKK